MKSLSSYPALSAGIIGFSLIFGQLAFAKPATEYTKAANTAVLETLPFDDKTEFEDAMRGFLKKPEKLVIKSAEGKILWDLESYKKFISTEYPAPDTVNPSLWRNTQLNMLYGLFEVVDGIYQVRGYDLSNITFIRGDTGWIVFDTGTTAETAKAAYDLVTNQFGKRTIHTVVISHTHIDHYGGIKGLVSEEDVKNGKVRVIAPEGFMEHAISEGVIAGNAMSRRAILMYGSLLPRGPEGSVGAGLGLTTPRGTVTLIEPTQYVSKTGEKMTVDGIEMIFQMTPGTEAPVEMNTWLPKFKALWMAENTTSTMHNVLTPRGAFVRDSLAWSKFINETIHLFGDKVEVKFQSHHWPKWGKDTVNDYLSKQRDLYKFIHDGSVNLMNQGYTGEEISEMIKLPPSLESFWPGRGYYGTLQFNSRAVYQRYMGWYDGNPSNLNNLPPVEAAKKYVRYMGGSEAVIKLAKEDFAKGEYRWTATVLKHVVFADPENKTAKELLADVYEQLAYQAESGPWRSIYLQGAYELRNGLPSDSQPTSVSVDTIKAMTPDLLFDYLGVRLNPKKAEGKKIALNMIFPDIKKEYMLTVSNSVLNYYACGLLEKADATITIPKSVLNQIQFGGKTVEEALKDGDIKIEGRKEAVSEFFSLFDKFSVWFNVVIP